MTSWFRQYAYCVPASWDAEAVPPTVAPSLTTRRGQRCPEPTGGSLSETSADAETNHTVSEQDKVPVSNFYHLIFLMQLMIVRRQKVKRTRATTAGIRPRKLQNEIDGMSPRLFAWFRRRNNGRDPVSFNEALTGTYPSCSAEMRSLIQLVLLQWRSTLYRRSGQQSAHCPISPGRGLARNLPHEIPWERKNGGTSNTNSSKSLASSTFQERGRGYALIYWLAVSAGVSEALATIHLLSFLLVLQELEDYPPPQDPDQGSSP